MIDVRPGKEKRFPKSSCPRGFVAHAGGFSTQCPARRKSLQKHPAEKRIVFRRVRGTRLDILENQQLSHLERYSLLSL